MSIHSASDYNVGKNNIEGSIEETKPLDWAKTGKSQTFFEKLNKETPQGAIWTLETC